MKPKPEYVCLGGWFMQSITADEAREMARQAIEEAPILIKTLGRIMDKIKVAASVGNVGGVNVDTFLDEVSWAQRNLIVKKLKELGYEFISHNADIRDQRGSSWTEITWKA